MVRKIDKAIDESSIGFKIIKQIVNNGTEVLQKSEPIGLLQNKTIQPKNHPLDTNTQILGKQFPKNKITT